MPAAAMAGCQIRLLPSVKSQGAVIAVQHEQMNRIITVNEYNKVSAEHPKRRNLTNLDHCQNKCSEPTGPLTPKWQCGNRP